jgi:hypothetical protein
MGLDEAAVEEPPKRRGDLLARLLNVRRDGGWGGDHLVAEASVELHMPCLVDLLGREKGRFLLRAMRSHQPRELGGDPLLGDHQRRECPIHETPILVTHPAPLRPIFSQIDLEGTPLRLLPLPVERLRIVEV